MDRKAALRVIGLALPLALAGIASSAQDGPPGQDIPGAPADFQRGGPPGGQDPFGGPPPGQFRGPGPGFGGPMGGPMAPEMAKKTSEIMALRQIKGMRLTSTDLKQALPILKSMRDSARDLQRSSEAALDAEKKALLAAGPDSADPPGAGEQMQNAMERHRQITEQSWQRLTQAIGPDKAGGIRGLLGQGGPGMRGPFGGPGGGPNGFGPGGQGGPFGGPGGQGPGGGGFGRGQGGGGGFGGGGRGQRGGPPQGGQPGQPGPDGGGDFGGPPPGQPGQPGFPPQGGQGGGQRRQPGQPGQGPGGGQFGGGFGRGGGFGGPGGPMMPPMMGGPAISISDLVDLLEQKLAVMRP